MKKRMPRLHPIRQNKYTKAQAAVIGYGILGYIEETAPREDDELGGGDLVEEVMRLIDHARKGGR